MENLLSRFKDGFKLKNALSNLYLYLEEIKSSEAQNVYRIGASIDSKKSIWKLKEEGNGYLYISSMTIQGEELFLTVTEDNNIDFTLLINKIIDIIIKAVISGYGYLISKLDEFNLNDRNFFNLYGYDFLIDNKYEPYLLDIDKRPDMYIYDNNDKY